jgi:hypothetical protein
MVWSLVIVAVLTVSLLLLCRALVYISILLQLFWGWAVDDVKRQQCNGPPDGQLEDVHVVGARVSCFVGEAKLELLWTTSWF